MKLSQRFTFFFITLPFVVCLAASSFGQTIKTDDSAAIARGAASPGYVRAAPATMSRTAPVLLFNPGTILDFPGDATTTSRAVFAADNNGVGGNGAGGSSGGAQNNTQSNFASNISSTIGGVITGLDTVPTFAGAFFNPNPSILGTRPNGVFPFIMVGNDPRVGSTTLIPTKITAVSLNLLNANGSFRATMPFAPFEDLTKDSPNFEEANYTSGHHIQFGDAVQRAEFFNSMDEDWHTVLGSPRIVNRVTFTIPRFVNVRFPDGSIKAVQAYFFGHAPNGDPFVELLDLLFNFLNNNQVVNDIIGGNFTTNAINVNMYPNTYLFSINNQGQFASCCVLGFHTYYLERGVTPQPRWIFNFASWISPGLFGAGFEDVTALSHEISETFDDPFVNTIVPTWQFPNQPPTSHACQANLETGDPVEVLDTATVPITLRERNEVFIYHPQTEALLQWFEMGATSDAIDGAFSFPDETALPHSATPCPK
jgi:hypothetical protein